MKMFGESHAWGEFEWTEERVLQTDKNIKMCFPKQTGKLTGIT